MKNNKTNKLKDLKCLGDNEQIKSLKESFGIRKIEISNNEAQEIRNWMYTLVDEFDRINPIYSVPLSKYIKTRQDVDLIPDNELSDYEYLIQREFKVSDADAEPFYVD